MSKRKEPTRQELLEQIAGLERTKSALQRKVHSLSTVLKGVDEALKGTQEYEALWINFPEKPQVSPADVVRNAIGIPGICKRCRDLNIHLNRPLPCPIHKERGDD